MTASGPAARKIAGLRWWIIALVAAATIVNYIDRSTLPVMWPGIARELRFTKEDYAAILSCFMVAYGVSQSLSGRLYDRIGTRRGFVASVLVWSFAEAGHALVRTIAGFGVCRSLLGLGEAGNWPGATKAIAEWFPVRERAFGQGIFNAGAAVGAIVSAPIVAALYVAAGWRWAFAAVGVLGLLWIPFWLAVNRALPRDHPAITPEELAHIGGPGARDERGAERVLAWRAMLRHRQSWAVIASRFFIDPIWWLFVSWLPLYLADRFKFDVRQIGLFAWVPYVGAAAGSLLGGWASGFLIGRGWSVDRARKATITFGGAVMFPGLIAAAAAATPLAAVLLIAAVLFGFQVTINNIQTLPGDFFSGGSVGLLAGLGGTSATAGVLVTIWLAPILTATSYVPFFLMGALLVPLGIASVFVFGGEIGPVAVGQ